jgi:hypothetical protein
MLHSASMRLLSAIAFLCTISTCFGFAVALPSAAVRARESLANRAAVMNAALPAALAGNALFAKGFGLSLLFSSPGYKKTSNFVTYGNVLKIALQSACFNFVHF